MTIDSIATSGTYNNNTWSVPESHRSQTIEVEILDFNHDELTTPINGKTKALMTVDIKDCLRDATGADDDGYNNTENGIMNLTETNVGGWRDSAIRKWCNGGFYQALPNYIRNLVKPVNKLSGLGWGNANEIVTTSDYIFLPSEIEVQGYLFSAPPGEGNQYAWFANARSNRYKLPRSGISTASNYWWCRSAYADRFFCCTGTDGGNSYGVANNPRCGLVPTWAF